MKGAIPLPSAAEHSPSTQQSLHCDINLGAAPPLYLHIPGVMMKAEWIDNLSCVTARARRAPESTIALRRVVTAEAVLRFSSPISPISAEAAVEAAEQAATTPRASQPLPGIATNCVSHIRSGCLAPSRRHGTVVSRSCSSSPASSAALTASSGTTPTNALHASSGSAGSHLRAGGSTPAAPSPRTHRCGTAPT